MLDERPDALVWSQDGTVGRTESTVLLQNAAAYLLENGYTQLQLHEGNGHFNQQFFWYTFTKEPETKTLVYFPPNLESCPRFAVVVRSKVVHTCETLELAHRAAGTLREQNEWFKIDIRPTLLFK